MKLLIGVIVLFLATKGVSQSVGSWTQWTEWSDCSGCDGTQESTARCDSGSGTGCFEGATRYRSKGCGGACPVCMNNIVESGEDCDCGNEQECNNNCCDAARCIWRSGIECTTGECCDKQTCYYKSTSEVCRESADECDLAEFCSGSSETCPGDVYKANATSCNTDQNYCFNGRCQNRDTLCEYLYGENATDGYTVCYDYNKGGTIYGNCGENGPIGGKTYTKCAREDVRCGTLQCINADELVPISEFKYLSNRRVTINEGTATFTCRSIYAIKKVTDEVVGYVQDGTVCGTEKVCYNRHCVGLSNIEVPNCPIGINGQVCSGNGECNQNRECVCDDGVTGVKCGETVTDAVWGQWSDWGACTQSCGSGTRTRARTCESSNPRSVGSNCVGVSSESGACNTDPCLTQVDGGWSNWASFSACSKSCGSGLSVLYRTCNSPAPSNGGQDCVGQPNKILYCNTHACGTDGGWSVWDTWSQCSVECGTGTRTRSRRCDSPEPTEGGSDCVGGSDENENCNIHTCEVPADGGWEEWSNWTPCTVTCGGGTIRRVRECTNPPPSGGGADCDGEPLQMGSCNEMDCPGIVQWTGWTQWTPCDVTCGVSLERRERERDCEQFSDCTQEESRMCNRIPCVLYTAGGWGDWTEWTQCSQTCGEGQRARSRACDNPIKGVLGPDCVGLSSDTEVCTLNNCPGEVVAGGWGAWTGWTGCSETCGSGVRARERACDSPLPVNGGLDCRGDREEMKACTIQECVVNGGWGEWSGFGECTQSCGGGVRTRSRSCDNPAKSESGSDCVGSGLDFEECNQQSCDTAAWGTWGAWSGCVGSCGTGEQRRERTCNDPNPSSGTIACPGAGVATKECPLNPCVVVGAWSGWSDWTECTQGCSGTEEQTRTRRCDNPEPSGGGSSCPGDITQTQSCDQTGCQECELSSYRIVSTCSLPCDTNSGISYSVRCVASGETSNCQKKTFVDRPCRSKLCNQQAKINLSSQCFIWLDLETLEPQCGTESEMVASINRKLSCSQSRILDLSARDLDLSNLSFSCILHSGSCVRQDN